MIVSNNQINLTVVLNPLYRCRSSLLSSTVLLLSVLLLQTFISLHISLRFHHPIPRRHSIITEPLRSSSVHPLMMMMAMKDDGASQDNAIGSRYSQPIEVYSTVGCKYCRVAKAKLTSLGVSYTNYDINDASTWIEAASNESIPSYVQERIEYSRAHTVPQIYLQQHHIGGCSELLAEVLSGVFQQRLQQYDILYASTMNNSSSGGGGDASKQGIDDVRAAVTDEYRPLNGEPLNSLRFNRDIMSSLEGMSSSDEVSAYLSRSSMPYTAIALSAQLQQKAMLLTDQFASPDGKRIQYHRMIYSEEFLQYVQLSTWLNFCSVDELISLSDREKLVFYSNLYNAMIIHANCVLLANEPIDPVVANDLRGPVAIAKRTAFFSGKSGAIYQLGPYQLSPDDIEHGMLRANLPHPSQVTSARASNTSIPLGYYHDQDPRSELSLSRSSFDPRIHFILNCGALSCPPIKVLTNDNAATAMVLAASSYLMSEVTLQLFEDDHHQPTEADNTTTSTNTSTTIVREAIIIYLPRLLLWYKDDFGPDLSSVMHRVIDMLPEDSAVRSQLTDLLSRGSIVLYSDDDVLDSIVEGKRYIKVQYNSYDWSFNGSTD